MVDGVPVSDPNGFGRVRHGALPANGAQSFVAALHAAGVDTLFGLPGSTEAPLLAALRADGGMRYVLSLHEGVTVALAAGYARASRRVGVVGLHTSVGTMNGMSQVYNAYRDNVPVVVTAGHKDRHLLTEDGFCALPDLPSLLRAFTKWSWQTLHAADVASDLTRALRVASAPPAGPTYLAIPEDLQAEPLGPGEGVVPAWPEPAGRGRGLERRPDGASVRAAAELLLRAERPMLMLGALAESAQPEARALAEALEMPVVAMERGGYCAVAQFVGDRRFLGEYGDEEAAVQDCDCLLAVGCRLFFPFSDARRPHLPPRARVVHVHPNPEWIGWGERTDVGLTGDAIPTLRDLTAAIADLGGTEPSLLSRRAAALTRLADGRVAALERERLAAPGHGVVPLPQLAEALRHNVPEGAIVVDEAVRSSGALLRHRMLPPRATLMTSAGGSLGFGVPSAIGAKIARPDRPVVCVVGDGSFQFTVQALWTAVQERAPVVVVVLDNGGYAAVKDAIQEHLRGARDGWQHPGTGLPAIDHATVATGYGARTVRIEGAEELGPAIRSAVEAERPSVIVVPIPR